MDILGISCYYHDSAACLLRDGEVVAAAAEERFTRKKHTSDFPIHAIDFCLEQAGKIVEEVDYIVFYEHPFTKFDRILKTAFSFWPTTYLSFVRSMPSWLKTKLHCSRAIQDELNTDKDIHFVGHHISHMASAYYCSPYDEAAILTVDGVGEWDTATLGAGDAAKLSVLKKMKFPHSIGLLYSAVTAYLGFRVNDAEWKVMGLTPYGEPRYVDALHQLLTLHDDGSIHLDMSYFKFLRSDNGMYVAEKWEALLGFSARETGAEIRSEHKNLAASVQVIVEEILLKMLAYLYQLHPSKNLCLAGGVGLNTVANWKILLKGPFENVYIQPASGDDGAAIGAAKFLYHHVLGHAKVEAMDHAYFGPSYGDDYIEMFLRNSGIRYEKLNREELLTRTVDALVDEKVLAWFQGRMEFGPRALGARSILANPGNPKMKEIINGKIKYREYFRPFAPVVPADRAAEFFQVDEGFRSPFMLFVPPVRSEKKALIPAVTHEDGSARIQTVTREQNSLYYDLLIAFGKRTDYPILLNTSFNVRGEPIVCSPRDAYENFIQSGIDVLVMGSFVVTEKIGLVDHAQGMARSDYLEK